MARLLRSVWLIILIVLLLPASWGTLLAQAPNSFSYSGLLTTPQGDPREGTFNMTFRVFDQPAGGTRLYELPINNVVVRRGRFSVLLGPFADSFMDGSGDRFLEIQINSEPPLGPPQRLISVPFALKASKVGSIDGAQGGSIQGNVGIGTPNPSQRLSVAGNIAASGGIGAVNGFLVNGRVVINRSGGGVGDLAGLQGPPGPQGPQGPPAGGSISCATIRYLFSVQKKLDKRFNRL